MLKLNEFIKKFDGTIFILGLVLIAVLLSGITNAFAGGVTDTANGTKGYILVNSDNKHQGVWTDPSFLKGEKGDTGATGQQGIAGINGLDGLNGLNGDPGIQGIQGFNGIDGTNGKDGLNGSKGDKGDKGVKGDKGAKGNKGDNGLNGLNGVDGNNGLDGINGIDGVKGDKGDTGANGKDVDPAVVNNLQNTDTTLQNNVNTEILDRQTADSHLGNRIDNVSNRVSKLERMQTKLQVGIRVYDSKRITVTPYISQNFTRGLVDEVGVRVTVKLGKSYEEKLIDKQNTRLSEIERKIGVAPVITQVVNEKGQTKSISITENGLAVKGKF